MLLKAQRAREAAAAGTVATAARSDMEEEIPGDFRARASPSRRHGVRNSLRCDVCSAGAVGGIGGRSREMDVTMSGGSGDELVPLGGGLLGWRLGLWRVFVFVFFVSLVTGLAFLLSTLPFRTSPVVTTEGPCVMPLFQDHAPATVELVVPVEAPKM